MGSPPAHPRTGAHKIQDTRLYLGALPTTHIAIPALTRVPCFFSHLAATSDALDMSLDDLIKQDKGPGGKAKGGGGKAKRRDASAPYEGGGGGRSNRPKACNNCGEIGHLKAKCRMEAREQARQQSRQGGGGGEKGHLASQADRAAGKRCNNCGVIGHLSGQARARREARMHLTTT